MTKKKKHVSFFLKYTVDKENQTSGGPKGKNYETGRYTTKRKLGWIFSFFFTVSLQYEVLCEKKRRSPLNSEKKG